MKINVSNYLILKIVRYLLFFFSILLIVFSVQIFVQNFNINNSINETVQTQKYLDEEKEWLKRYYGPYLNSDYALHIFKHKNAIPEKDEILIKIITEIPNNTHIKEDKLLINNKLKMINLNWKIFFLSLTKKLY